MHPLKEATVFEGAGLAVAATLERARAVTIGQSNKIKKSDSIFWVSYKADKLLCLGLLCPCAWGTMRGAIVGLPQQRWQLGREFCN